MDICHHKFLTFLYKLDVSDPFQIKINKNNDKYSFALRFVTKSCSKVSFNSVLDNAIK